MQSRYYDPELGRFLNADAYVSTGQGILGNNMFAYCNNNPVMWDDPTGNFTVDWDKFKDKIIKWLMGLTESDEEAIEDGEVTYESNGKGEGALIDNSYKIKTPWAMYAFIEMHRGNDIAGSTAGVVFEWICHNIAYEVGNFFGIDSIAISAKDLDIGKTIFDDEREPFSAEWFMSLGMKAVYVRAFPILGIYDFIAGLF